MVMSKTMIGLYSAAASGNLLCYAFYQMLWNIYVFFSSGGPQSKPSQRSRGSSLSPVFYFSILFSCSNHDCMEQWRHDTRQILAIGFLPQPCQSVLISPPPVMPRGWIFLPKKMKNTLLLFISDMKNLLRCTAKISFPFSIGQGGQGYKIEITGNNFLIKSLPLYLTFYSSMIFIPILKASILDPR